MRRVSKAKRDVLDRVRALNDRTLSDEARNQRQNDLFGALGKLDGKLWHTRRARVARWLQEEARVRGMLRR